MKKLTLFIISFTLTLQANTDVNDNGLEDYKDILDYKHIFFESEGSTLQYSSSTNGDLEIKVSANEIPDDWKICTPGEPGGLISCDQLSYEHIALALHTPVCNTSGTGYNIGGCEVIDCHEGYTGENCEDQSE